MGDFGKLDFSISLNPTSAFPLDARCYFTSLEQATTAAASAQAAGSTDSNYYFGMRLMVDNGTTIKWYTIQRDKTLKEDINFEPITEAVYEARKEAGTLDPTTFYCFIPESTGDST